MKTRLVYWQVCFIVLCIEWLPLAGEAQTYENYFRYIGNYPHNAEPEFANRANGVTHDDSNWFFTQQEVLWKIPVEFDLNNLPESNRILKKEIGDIPQLANGPGYNHFGDLSYHNGYLFIPLETADLGDWWSMPGIGVFKASDLEYVGFCYLETKDGSWCAVNNKGDLYTSPKWENIDSLSQYRIRWDLLAQNPPQVKIEFVKSFPIYDISGNKLTIQHSQGADFSESGKLLFVLTGGPSSSEADCAIHVFDTSTWRRIAVSSQTDPFFNYECHPGQLGDESEGVTVWDLDDGRAPNIWGQLHVIQIDVDIDSDDLYFQHYSGVTYVDAAYAGGNGDGRITSPYTTVSAAANFAWNGSKVKIEPGSYHNPVFFGRNIQVLSWHGTAVFGNMGRVSLSSPAAINLMAGGAIRIY